MLNRSPLIATVFSGNKCSIHEMNENKMAGRDKTHANCYQNSSVAFTGVDVIPLFVRWLVIYAVALQWNWYASIK